MITREMAKWKIFFLVLKLQSRALWRSWAQRPFWFPFLIGRTAVFMTCEFQGAEQLLIKQGCSHRVNCVQISCDPLDAKQVAISSLRGSSRPRNRTQVSCTGRCILYHCTDQETRPPKTLHKTSSCHQPHPFTTLQRKQEYKTVTALILSIYPQRTIQLLPTHQGGGLKYSLLASHIYKANVYPP